VTGIELETLTESTAADVVSWFEDDEEGRRRAGFFRLHPKWWELVAADDDRHGFITVVEGEPVGLVDLEQVGERVNVGFYVRAERRRCGLGSEVAAAVVTRSRELSDARRLVAEVEPYNLASVRCCERVGFVDRGANDFGARVLVLDV
jgi:RimJ/RimL family protein N-acetyltransferase